MTEDWLNTLLDAFIDPTMAHSPHPMDPAIDPDPFGAGLHPLSPLEAHPISHSPYTPDPSVQIGHSPYPIADSGQGYFHPDPSVQNAAPYPTLSDADTQPNLWDLHAPHPSYTPDSGLHSAGYATPGHGFHFDSARYNFPHHDPVVLHSSSTHCGTYTTISDSGSVYKHTSDNSTDSYYAGYVNDRSVYNPSGHYQGYGGTDGKIYDHHDHCVGWVDACGDVYNRAGVQIYHTTKGVVGGAAYLLLVYHGGVC